MRSLVLSPRHVLVVVGGHLLFTMPGAARAQRVVFGDSGINDQQGHVDIALTTSGLEARSIVVFPESTADLPSSLRQADTLHLTTEVHGAVATRRADPVMRALGQGS